MKTYLPLRGHGAKASRDTEDEGVEGGEVVGSYDRVVRLRGGVHLCQDLLRESLRDPVVVSTRQCTSRP